MRANFFAQKKRGGAIRTHFYPLTAIRTSTKQSAIPLSMLSLIMQLQSPTVYSDTFAARPHVPLKYMHIHDLYFGRRTARRSIFRPPASVLSRCSCGTSVATWRSRGTTEGSCRTARYKGLRILAVVTVSRFLCFLYR